MTRKLKWTLCVGVVGVVAIGLYAAWATGPKGYVSYIGSWESKTGEADTKWHVVLTLKPDRSFRAVRDWYGDVSKPVPTVFMSGTWSPSANSIHLHISHDATRIGFERDDPWQNMKETSQETDLPARFGTIYWPTEYGDLPLAKKSS